MASWLSKPAVLWAMDEAPDVPAHLFGALVAVARYADEHGCGAHPSASTVAAIIRKTERNAKKDLAELRRRGLLLAGDQQLVKDIRPDKRPFVYDLPMPRGDAHDTPNGVTHTTPRDGCGVSHRVERGVAQGQNGVSHTTPKEVLKTSRRRARDAADAAAPPRAEPEDQRRAPPCPECGKPFSSEQLADPDFRYMAMRGEVNCGSPECDKADEDKFIAGATISDLLEMGYYDEAAARDPGAVAAILGDSAGTPPLRVIDGGSGQRAPYAGRHRPAGPESGSAS